MPSPVRSRGASPRRRAILPEDKSERRAAIVQAAEALLRRAPMGAFSVDALAQRAGLAKGTVYLYFRSREEVLLAVHAANAQRMFDALERALDAPAVNATVVVRATREFLREHPGFLPLASTCRSMLENNIGAEAALEFKRALGTRLSRLGARVEEVYPRLAPGAGVALLMNCYALMIGLWQLADAPACLRDVMQRPDMKVFRIDLEKQLMAALSDLWRAAERRGESAGQ